MKSLIKEKQIYRIIILLLLVSVFLYSVERIYVFFLYPDEFGYWSTAATALGWDWREVSGLGSFYSYGYSFILLPILKITSSSLTAYRMAIAVNMILMCAAFFLLQIISRDISSHKDGRRHIFFAGIAVFYPAWIFYMQFTATEALLTFLFVLIAWLFLLFMEKPRIHVAIFLALALGYSFVVHMRSVGVVIACGLTIAVWGICSSGNKKKILMLAAALVVVLVAAFLLKDIVRQSVYSGAGEDLLKNNEFGGQFDKIRFILSAEGILQLIKNVSGKILYLGTASMGLFYFGVFWCIRQAGRLIRGLRNQESLDGRIFWGIFLMLAVIGEVMIGSIYSVQTTDLDWIIYGRYSEFILPVIMVVGLCQMYKLRRLPMTVMAAWLLHTVFSMICLVTFAGEEPTMVRGYMSVGVSYLIGIGEVDPGLFILQVWILGSIFLFVVSFFMYIEKKNKGMVWLLGVLLGAEIALGLYASHIYVYPVNDYMRYELYLGETIMEDFPSEMEILYLDEGRTQWIDVIQMQLRERSIRVISREELDNRAAKDTVLIAHKDGQYRDALAEKYRYCKEYNVFCLYYNDVRVKSP